MQIQQVVRAGTRAGSVLVTAVVVTMFVGTLALLTVSLSTRHQHEADASGAELNAFYAAEAGLSAAWVERRNGGDGNLGSADAPERLGGLGYWVEAAPVDDGVSSLVATGTDGHRTRRVELIVRDDTKE